MTFAEMVAMREKLECADKTMICFSRHGVCYAIVTTLNESWIKEEHASTARGGQLKARIRINANDQIALTHCSDCVKLGTEEEVIARYEKAYFSARGKKAPRNKGWAYECAVTEILAKEAWEPDNVPFWKAPDVVINGIGYQIKGDGAEFFTESCLRNAMEELGLA